MVRFFPPEWYPQEAILMTWPHPNSAWQQVLPLIEPTFLNLAHAITQSAQALWVVVDPSLSLKTLQDQFKSRGISLEQVQFLNAPSNDTWIRDYGPITIYDDAQRTMLDFQFNGWGGKFDATQDNQVSVALHQQGAFGSSFFKTLPWFLEGGSIETDGAGTLLTTSSCLLTPTRNPHFSQNDVEQLLKKELGVSQILWLNYGDLEGDDTDGHVDMMARFCDAQTIAYALPSDSSHDHFKAFKSMEGELKTFRNTVGHAYRLVPIEVPEPVYSAEGQRLPGSYLNFLILNHAVLVPIYQTSTDDLALQQLGQCFPNKKIIPIDSLALIHQGGSFHCSTMQIPAAQKRQ